MAHDLDGAIADLSEAIDLDGTNARAYQSRGLAHQANSNLEGAIADYTEAIRLDPENPERYVMRAWVSHLAGRNRLALIDADQAVAINPDLVSPHRTRAAILAALGDEAAARGAAADGDEAKANLTTMREDAQGKAAEEQKRRLEARLEQEKTFLEDYDGRHPYIYPAELAAAALGFSYDDDAVVDYNDELSQQARGVLADMQRLNGLRGTGHLDEATFLMLLNQPVDPEKYVVEEPWDAKAEAIGDWFFTPGTEWCAIWTKPTAIAGRFAPDFGKLPLFAIHRDRTESGNSLSQDYADGDLFKEDAEVVINAGTTLKTQRNGGGYGPTTTCDDKGCYGSDEVLKAVRVAQAFDVVGELKFGGELTISYSAAGFTKAYNRLDRECSRGRIGTWLR